MADRHRYRGTTTQRGYGAKHQAIRARLLPAAYGTVCPLGCGRVMVPSMKLDLDHSTPLAHDRSSYGDRIVCARCNRRRGGQMNRGRSRVHRTRTATDLPTSRIW